MAKSTTQTQKQKQWTVMVYLAGDNNLDDAGVADLEEMKKVGSSPDVNVIAQVDRQGDKGATRRYFLKKGTTLAKDSVASLGETNTGDPDVFESFLRWGIKSYPAHRYLVVVWNHGNGWDDEDIYRAARSELKLNVRRRDTVVAPARGSKARGSVSIRRLRTIRGQTFRRALFRTSVTKAVATRGIAYDDNAQDFLDNVEMKRVLASVTKTLKRPIDVLGMDACLMSMAEVCYQLRDHVSVTVGSEEVEPGDGWPYDKILTELVKNPALTGEELGRKIVEKYIASYDANANVTQSACDLAKSGVLATNVDRLADALNEKLGNAAIRSGLIQARNQVQKYDRDDYVDLHDLCELIRSNCDDASIDAACQAVTGAIQTQRFVLAAGAKGSKVRFSNGLSIYFPQGPISSLYATLDFAKKTSWDAFLRRYQAATSRSATRTPALAGAESPDR